MTFSGITWEGTIAMAQANSSVSWLLLKKNMSRVRHPLTKDHIALSLANPSTMNHKSQTSKISCLPSAMLSEMTRMITKKRRGRWSCLILWADKVQVAVLASTCITTTQASLIPRYKALALLTSYTFSQENSWLEVANSIYMPTMILEQRNNPRSLTWTASQRKVWRTPADELPASQSDFLKINFSTNQKKN